MPGWSPFWCEMWRYSDFHGMRAAHFTCSPSALEVKYREDDCLFAYWQPGLVKTVLQEAGSLKANSTESLFHVFDQTVAILQEELDYTYLEGLAETAENLFQQEVLQNELSEVTKKRLRKKYGDVQLASLNKKEIRKAYQLAILKGMAEGTQPNHQMTPDSIGFIFAYLTSKFLAGQQNVKILDPAVGTGNLLFTVIDSYPSPNIEGYGVEIDDVLLRLAFAGANLMEQSIQFYNQDSLEPLFIDPVDLVISDLPVGYYPNDLRSADYELKSAKGHSYAHHLFIEQSMKHTKQGGFLMFLIPNQLFESEEAPSLHAFIKKYAYIQGIIQLPLSMFKSEKSAKSILILQKKMPGIKAPGEVLLAALPKLSNKAALDHMVGRMEAWFRENKQTR